MSLDLTVVLPFFTDANTSCRMRGNPATWASNVCLALIRFSCAVYDHPFNDRVSALFGQPNTTTHGPVLAMKMIFLKIWIDIHHFEEQEGLYLLTLLAGTGLRKMN